MSSRAQKYKVVDKGTCYSDNSPLISSFNEDEVVWLGLIHSEKEVLHAGDKVYYIWKKKFEIQGKV